MEPITPETLTQALQWRYAVKKFDPTRRIPDDLWSALEQALVLTPTSFGLQPYRFIVVTDPDLKAALPPHTWNQSQPKDCSHLVVVTSKLTMTADDIDHYLARVTEVTGAPKEALAGYRGMMVGSLVQGPGAEHIAEWAAKQAYIALGFFLEAAALLGVDACPMEGFVPSGVDQVLGLPGSGYTSTVLIPAGYRAADDGYAARKKVRFPASELILRR